MILRVEEEIRLVNGLALLVAKMWLLIGLHMKKSHLYGDRREQEKRKH